MSRASNSLIRRADASNVLQIVLKRRLAHVF